MSETFSDFLQAQGHDESTMGSDRRNQLFSFYKEKLAQPAAPVARDHGGRELAIGDTVYIEAVVTGIHAVIDPETGRLSEERATVNLQRDGHHWISCSSNWVQKA